MRISDWSSDVCSSDLLNHGGTEMGQGLNTKVAQVVAEVFQVEMDRVQITATNTDKVPTTSPTAAPSGERKSAVQGKRVYVRVDLGGRRIIKKRRTSITHPMRQLDHRQTQHKHH